MEEPKTNSYKVHRTTFLASGQQLKPESIVSLTDRQAKSLLQTMAISPMDADQASNAKGKTSASGKA